MLHQDGANKKETMKTKGVNAEDGLRDDVEDAVHKVGSATGCTDFNLIVQNLEAENYNIESAIIAVLQMNQGAGNDTEENREPGDRVKQRGPSRERQAAAPDSLEIRAEMKPGWRPVRLGPALLKKTKHIKASSQRSQTRRGEQQLEKKKRSGGEAPPQSPGEERRQQGHGRGEAEANTQVTLVKTFAALNI